MIIAKIQDSAHIEALHPAFKTLFDYVKSQDFTQVPLGRIELDGEKLFVNNDTPVLRSREEQCMEVHRRYIDVHIPLDKVETIGWKATCDCCNIKEDYDETHDRMFYNDTPSTYIDVQPGEFCICYPEDAHAPIIGEGTLRKLVAKVLL